MSALFLMRNHSSPETHTSSAVSSRYIETVAMFAKLSRWPILKSDPNRLCLIHTSAPKPRTYSLNRSNNVAKSGDADNSSSNDGKSLFERLADPPFPEASHSSSIHSSSMIESSYFRYRINSDRKS